MVTENKVDRTLYKRIKNHHLTSHPGKILLKGLIIKLFKFSLNVTRQNH